MGQQVYGTIAGIAVSPTYLYLSLGCFLVFRIGVSLMQHSEEIRSWRHRRRHARLMRSARGIGL